MKIKRRITNLIVPIVIIIALVLAFCQFFISLKADVKKATYADLEATAEQNLNVISTKISGQYNLLNSLANHISLRYEPENLETVLTIMKDFSKTSGFSFLGITTDDGTTYLTDGTIDDSSRDFFFKTSMRGKNAIEFVNDESYPSGFLVMSVPVYSTYEGIDGVLFGCFLTSDFEKILISSSYGENTYSFLTTNEGGIIVRSSNPNFLHQTDNIFDLYSISTNPSITLDEFWTDLKENKSGVAELTISGAQRYILYNNLSESLNGSIPKGAENWFLFTSVPVSAVTTQNSFIPATAAILTAELAVIIAVCIIYILFTERKKAVILKNENEVVRQSEEMYRIVNDFSNIIIFVYDCNSGTVKFNSKYEKLFKRKPYMDALGDFSMPNPYINKYDYSAYSKVINDVLAGVPRSTSEFRILRPDGLYDWYKAEITTLFDLKGRPLKIIGKLSNVQEHHTAIEELTLRAESDSLTHIFNHNSMKERVNRYLSGEGRNSIHALLYIDIDNFKKVNDSLGHMIGDDLLINVAETMQRVFRETDFVGRLGGDEFAIFVKDMHYEAMIDKKTENLLTAISKMVIPNSNLTLSCSIGVAIYNKHGANFEQLYSNADKALYKAKMHKNSYVIYSPDDVEMQHGAHETTYAVNDDTEDYDNPSVNEEFDDPSQN